RRHAEDGFGGLRWRLGTIGNVTWWLATSVPLAIALLMTLTLIGRSDLGTEVAGLILIWMVGVILQIVVACAALWHFNKRAWAGEHASTDHSPSLMTISVSGLWMSPVNNHQHPPKDLFTIWVTTSIALVLAGSAAITMSSNSFTELPSGWTMPSLGNDTIDQPIAAAGWLWLMQAAWQLLPIPQSFGRVGWTIGAVLCSAEIVTAVNHLRRIVLTIGLAIAAAAIAISGLSTTFVSMPMIAILVLSVWLLVSSRSSDWLRIASVCDDGITPGAWRYFGSAARRSMRQPDRHQPDPGFAQVQTRDISAMESETLHEEPKPSQQDEVERAESVLDKLHETSWKALTNDEKAVLWRASEAARRRRGES
ncbi:MAG: hypothetical protein AAF745_11980, partial [Planctomycetota bacterium]